MKIWEKSTEHTVENCFKQVQSPVLVSCDKTLWKLGRVLVFHFHLGVGHPINLRSTHTCECTKGLLGVPRGLRTRRATSVMNAALPRVLFIVLRGGKYLPPDAPKPLCCSCCSLMVNTCGSGKFPFQIMSWWKPFWEKYRLLLYSGRELRSLWVVGVGRGGLPQDNATILFKVIHCFWGLTYRTKTLFSTTISLSPPPHLSLSLFLSLWMCELRRLNRKCFRF